MVPKTPAALRLDDHEFADISAPADDSNGERASAAGLQPIKFKLYDWDQVKGALAAGATEAEAKRQLTPHYFEFHSIAGTARIVLLESGKEFEERGSVNVLVRDGLPHFEFWDERSENEEPDAQLTLGC